MLKRFAGLLIPGIYLVSLGLWSFAEETPTHPIQRVSYVDRGMGLDNRNLYKFELVKQILEATRAKYGDYEIKPYNKDPGAYRLALMMSKGEEVNLLWASPGTVISKAKVIPVDFDILKGIQGYRVCIVGNKSNLSTTNIRTRGDLKHIKVAQGIGWAELEIYQYNKIPILTSANYEGLFEMVSSGRADCVPIGANEAFSVINASKLQRGNLDIEPSLLIYYPYPMNFYVSQSDPLLASRIQDGLKQLEVSGVFSTLFEKYFGQDLKALKIENRHVICLDSPYSPENASCKHPENILATYRNNIKP